LNADLYDIQDSENRPENTGWQGEAISWAIKLATEVATLDITAETAAKIIAKKYSENQQWWADLPHRQAQAALKQQAVNFQWKTLKADLNFYKRATWCACAIICTIFYFQVTR
jgi:hypothetical protein